MPTTSMPCKTCSGSQTLFTFENNWKNKLLQFGLPLSLASQMAPDVASLGISPSSVSTIHQLIPIMQNAGFQSLDWWTYLQTFLQLLVAVLPSIVLIGVGGGLLWLLRNVKVKKIPVGLVGLIPMGFGMLQLIQQLQTQSTGGI